MNEELAVNAEQLSQRTGLSKWTIYNLVSQRRIPHVKVGRRVLFPLKAIEKWLEDRTVSLEER